MAKSKFAIPSSRNFGSVLLIRRRLPGDGPDTIEAKQAEFRAEPEITVGRLGNGVDDVPGKTVAVPPRILRVLADIERWI